MKATPAKVDCQHPEFGRLIDMADRMTKAATRHQTMLYEGPAKHAALQNYLRAANRFEAALGEVLATLPRVPPLALAADTASTPIVRTAQQVSATPPAVAPLPPPAPPPAPPAAPRPAPLYNPVNLDKMARTLALRQTEALRKSVQILVSAADAVTQAGAGGAGYQGYALIPSPLVRALGQAAGNLREK